MKTSTLILSLAALVLSSCAKDVAVSSSQMEDSQVSVSFTASLACSGTTRASIDEDGRGVYADRCLLQVWRGDVLCYQKTRPVIDYKASFSDIILTKDQTYDFLFWADNEAGDFYVTDTLTKVRFKSSYIGNNDKRDAFFGALNNQTVTDKFSQRVTLTRPFAQLNVIATDVSDIYSQLPDKSQFTSVMPDRVSLEFTAPSRFNVKTGIADDPDLFSYSAGIYTSPYKTVPYCLNTVSMDYILAPGEEGNLVDISFGLDNAACGIQGTKRVFTNVPLQRNYRTNIAGAVISASGKVDVVVSANWDEPEYNKYY